MKLLHIDSSSLGNASVSRQLTASVVEAWRRARPGLEVAYRDLALAPPAHLSGEIIGGADRALTNELLEEFLAAEVVVIGAPMYNFGVPTQLKAWIDRIVQAGHTFRYTENGPVGLVGGKTVVIASSRGGVYSESEQMSALDHQESFLRTVLGFIGVTDVRIVRAEGVAMGPEARAKALEMAQGQIERLLEAA